MENVRLSVGEMKQIAKEVAEKANINWGDDSFVRIHGPKRGDYFSDGPFTIAIPKLPRFAPYIIEINSAVLSYNDTNRLDQIRINSEGSDYIFTFDARQFSSAFGGLYKPSIFCRSIENLVDPNEDDFDDYSIAVLRALERNDKKFLQ